MSGPPRFGASAAVEGGPRSRRPRAFTLIELLVVLGVIALLIGLLAPALNRTREVAKAAVCLSNARQIGIAVNAYLVGSNGRLPSLRNRGSLEEPGPALDTEFDDAPAVHRCPSDRDSGGSPLWQTTGTSYFWNFTLNGQRVEAAFSLVGGADLGQIPVVSDKEGFHPHIPDRVNILYADGHAASELRFVLPPETQAP